MRICSPASDATAYSELEYAARSIGSATSGLSEIQPTVDSLASRMGGLSVLISNAGMMTAGLNSANCSLEAWHQEVAVDIAHAGNPGELEGDDITAIDSQISQNMITAEKSWRQ